MQRFVDKCIIREKSRKNMKALLLSFFVVVLCYSLFLDGENEAVPENKLHNTTMQTEAYDYVHMRDTTTFYASSVLPWS